MTRILIADPTPSSRRAFTLLIYHKLNLSNIGEAGDAETLIRVLADDPPDILLLDWRLYGAPAPETCRLLRKAYPALKIVLLSVNADDQRLARDAGAMFIHKGASPDAVVALLEPLLGKIADERQKNALSDCF